MIELKNTFELCDIWRLRNPKIKRFTFRQNHKSGFIQSRLDFFFVSNVFLVLQESIHKTDVLASFCSDHSPILFVLDMIKEGQMGKGLWKFNSSLLSNKKFVCNMKNYIATTTIFLNEENIFDDQIRSEYLKYEIRKFSTTFLYL